MDLAGAMGMDVVEAANAVGKALAGGSGAADQLREKGILTMVEVTAGMGVAEMSTNEFREALVKTLETSDRVAGGTQVLAETYSGLMSTLQDQFTVFSKQVADAKLFEAAKLILQDVLRVLGDNKDATGDLADVVGGQLTNALLGVAANFGFIFAMTARVARGIGYMQQAAKGFQGLINRISDAWLKLQQNILEAGKSMRAAVGMASPEHDKNLAKIKAERRENFEAYRGIVIQNDALRKQEEVLDGVVERFSNAKLAVENIKLELARLDETGVTVKLQHVDADGKPIKEGAGAVMKTAGVDAKQVKKDAANLKKREADLKKFMNELNKLSGGFTKAAAATGKPLKKSEELAIQFTDMTNQMLAAKQAAATLGPTAVAAFKEAEAGMVAAANAVLVAAEKTRGQEIRADIGAGMEGAADVMSTGGLGLLGGLGPMGGGAASLIGVGQQGQQAVEDKAKEDAQKAADKRSKGMQKEAEAMKAAGYSDEEIAAAGLGREDIAKAGKVTKKDIKEARGKLDEDQIMADQVASVVQGVIDGVQGIIKGLPEILKTLIPMLLVELPTALIEAIPELIEELIPVLLFDLPKALFIMIGKVGLSLIKLVFRDLWVAIGKGVAKWWDRTWEAIKRFFKSVLSFGIMQTGGFVPKTGMNLLHQGERVIPASGAGSQTATKGLQAFTGGGGPSLTVNTNVVDPDSIGSLGKLINSELGPMGRSTVPIFGTTNPTSSI